MRLKIYFGILLSALINGCVCPAFAQSYFKGPALIETPTITSTAASTTTLTKDSQSIQIFTGTSAQTVKLPDGTSIPNGRYFEIFNQSTQSLSIVDDGSNPLFTLKPNAKVKMILTNNATSNGTWSYAVSYGDIDAEMVSVEPFDDLVSTNVQDILEEFNTKVEGIISNLGASDIAYDNATSGLTATDTQSAIDEIVTIIDNFDALPDQSGNAGKFLTTDGTDASWADVDALPDQSGNAGKFLTTDGTDASWQVVDALPAQTGQGGKVLRTDGAVASWETDRAIVQDSAIQTLANDAEAVLLPVQRQKIRVQGSGGPVDFTIPSPTLPGQELFIMGVNNNNPPTLYNTYLGGGLLGNVVLNGDVTFYQFTQIHLLAEDTGGGNYIWVQVQ